MRKTGFIAIVGRPNVGKSTLMNGLLGEKVAIVSSKPQTTRNRILGILTKDENQFIFVDTPGIHSPQNSLGEYMVKTANASMQDSDVVVLVVDLGHPITNVEENIMSYVKKAGVPCILALNKTDLYNANQVADAIIKYSAKCDFSAFVPVCAKNGKGLDALLGECAKYLGESEWIFAEDELTDQPERQIAAEIIREKLLRTLDKEVPHGVAVVIDQFKESKGLISIYATIYCEKDSHKGIIVGKNGEELKRVGSYARADIEQILGVSCYLNLWVKVKRNWRESTASVANFGYKNQEDK